MTKLTEHTVLARTRAQDLKSVRKLNAWGSELTDVSIVKSLPNVEVLSLSVNSIASLQDFAHCNNLQELYLRKNNIADLTEIRYLQDLPKLRSLWLADNPCAEAEHYRLTVIRALPQLQKLDNITIQPEELENAKAHGNLLDSIQNTSQQLQESGTESVSYCETSRSSEHTHMSFAFESSVASKVATPQPSPMEPFPPICENEATSPTRSCIEDSASPVHYKENEQSFDFSPHPYSVPSKSSSGGIKQSAHANETKVPFEADSSIERSAEMVVNDRFSSTSSFTSYAVRNSNRSDRVSASRMLPKGGKNRNANILSAVLCLIKELDWPSLEVVDTAVHCLMEELEAESDDMRANATF